MRQNEIRINALKNLVWQKTLEWIRANAFAQTAAVPTGMPSVSSGAAPRRKQKYEGFEAGPLRAAIAKALGTEDEVAIEAHHFVESQIIPRFQEGMPVDILHEYNTDNWTTNVQDCYHQ